MLEGNDRRLTVEGNEETDSLIYDDAWLEPTGRFDLPVPIALGLKDWDAWTALMKSKYPIRYFFRRTLKSWGVDIYDRLRDKYWKVIHRIHPKHRYHTVDTGLPAGYHDPRSRIFAASFELLCKFVDYNIKIGIIDWEGDEGHSHAWKEMNELREWYRNERPSREDVWDAENPHPKVNWQRVNEDTPEGAEYRAYLVRHNDIEQLWDTQDEGNFIRLIKIRNYLWYA